MLIKRKKGLGNWRGKVPGYGWITCLSGEFIEDKKGKAIEFNDFDWLGKHINDFETPGGNPLVDLEEEQLQTVNTDFDQDVPPIELKIEKHKKIGNNWTYNVINVQNEKPLNDHPLTKKQAEQFLNTMMDQNTEEGVCPLENGVFGATFNDFDQCVSCNQFEYCEKANEAQE